MAGVTIGKAAQAAGVGVETIRFYERRGLIEQPSRPAAGGPRRYDEETLARIRFIRRAQHIGFSLSEIAELLSLRADPGADCADVRERAVEKRDEVEARMADLVRIRSALDELIRSCPGAGDLRACSILDAIDRADAVGRSTALEHEHKEKGTMKTTVFEIDGMHCDGCAQTVETLLRRVPGVRKVEASFDARQARVLHDPAQTPEAALVAAVAKGGFTATETGR